jgi:hypothetical protein
MTVLKLIQERDQRIASDTRTAAERWLGDSAAASIGIGAAETDLASLLY